MENIVSKSNYKRLAEMRRRGGGEDDPVCSSGSLLHISGLECNSKLGAMMTEARQPD